MHPWVQRIRAEPLVALLLVLSTFAVYAPALRAEFVNLDDPVYVTRNRQVQQGITAAGVRWAFSVGYAGYWHPLTWLSHMLDCQLYGLNPAGHHLTSILLHAANALLLFLVLRRMTDTLWRSAMVAALFALHPLRVESVAWVAERKDVLSMFFGLLTLLAYARYVERPGVGRYALVALLLALGLAAKPMLVTLPVVLLLLDYWPLGRLQAGDGIRTTAGRGPAWSWPIVPHLVAEKSPLFLLVIASSVLIVIAQRRAGAMAPLAELSVEARLANALVAYFLYVFETVWPIGLAVFYPLPAARPGWQAAAAALGLVAVTAWSMGAARRRPYLPVGWLWFVVALLPVSGLVQVGSQAMADRFSYLPQIGLLIAATWGAHDLLHRRPAPTPVLGASAALLLGALALASWRQVLYWRSSLVLFTRALEVTSGNYLAHENLGAALAAQGKLDEAIAHYTRALDIKPGYPYAHKDLGAALAAQGKLDEAVAHLAAALRREPDLADAQRLLGNALAQQGSLEEAVVHYTEALRLDPDNAEVHVSLGVALANLGKPGEAATQFAEAVRLVPGHVEANTNLARALAQEGKFGEAIGQFRTALRLAPDQPDVLDALAWLLATSVDARLRDGVEAARLAERACVLIGRGRPELLDTLAAAYAEAGRFTEAVRVAEEARALAGSSGQDALARSIQTRLELYRADRPYRQGPGAGERPTDGAGDGEVPALRDAP